MREFSWMNISGVITALRDNTGSLNGFVLSHYTGNRELSAWWQLS